MDHIKILKRAWEITWRYPALWVFGIILALTTAQRGRGPLAQYNVRGEDFAPGGDFHIGEIPPDVVNALIAIGIDVLNPIQWRCKGMDREGLKRDFGDRLVFHGGVDNQQPLPFGTPDDVRREVLDNLRILGAGGGYILAPCHNIQPVTPVANILALYQTGYEHGWT